MLKRTSSAMMMTKEDLSSNYRSSSFQKNLKEAVKLSWETENFNWQSATRQDKTGQDKTRQGSAIFCFQCIVVVVAQIHSYFQFFISCYFFFAAILCEHFSIFVFIFFSIFFFFFCRLFAQHNKPTLIQHNSLKWNKKKRRKKFFFIFSQMTEWKNVSLYVPLSVCWSVCLPEWMNEFRKTTYCLRIFLRRFPFLFCFSFFFFV